MTYEAIENAIRNRFQTLIIGPLESGNPLPVEYDNVETPKTDATKERWVRHSIKFGEARQVDKSGLKRFRVVGVMYVQIFYEAGRGTKEANTLVDLINTNFRAKTDTGVVFRTPTRTDVGRVKNWWQVTVACPFYADDIET